MRTSTVSDKKPLNRLDRPGIKKIVEQMIWDGEAGYPGVEPLITSPMPGFDDWPDGHVSDPDPMRHYSPAVRAAFETWIETKLAFIRQLKVARKASGEACI
jgi:hypothetical protein